LQHCLDHPLRAAQKITGAIRFLQQQRGVALLLRGRQRTAERPQSELPHKPHGRVSVGCRARLSGQETTCVVTPQKSVAGQAIRRRIISLCQKRWNILRGNLITKTVDEVLFGELIRRSGFVAQQVAHGVVVLAVREAAHRALRFRRSQS